MAETRIVKRDANGQFIKGHSPKSPGGPIGTKSQRLKAAILDATTIAQAQRIFKKIATMAEEGDLAAAKLYLRYIAGDPKHRYDPREGQVDGEQKRKGPEYTAQERLIIGRAMAREAERELRGQEPIDVEVEEVDDEAG